MKLFKKLTALVMAFATAFSVTAFAEPSSDEISSSESAMMAVPEINAASAILVNADTGRILYEKNSKAKMYPASLTKILTAMVVLDNMEPDETIKTDYSVNIVPLDSSRAGVKVYEVLTVENVIRGLIIPSGNDIAVAAAVAVTEKNLGKQVEYEEAEEYFTGLMNEKAKSLGCENSHFANPHGYHQDDHYTTAYDMALISEAAMKYDVIKRVVAEVKFEGNGAGRQKYTVDGSTQDYTWYSHNKIITSGPYYYEYANGIKTGFTDQAGDCLSASATKDNENLIAIIMNSEDPERWYDAQKLFDYGFNNYDFVEYRPAGVAATATLTGHNRLKGDTVELTIKNPLSEYLTADEAAAVTTNIIYDNAGDFLEAPVKAGERVGVIQFLLGDEVIGQEEAFAAMDVKKSNIFNSAAYLIKTFFAKLAAPENHIFVVIGVVVVLFIIVIFILRHKRKMRYKIRGNYRNRTTVYDTSRINQKKRKHRNPNRDKYNKYR